MTSPRRRWLGVIAVLALALGLAGEASAVQITGQITGSSADDFTIAELQAFPASAVVVGGDTFVGVSLWTLLGGTSAGASNIVTVGGGNNPILRNYIVATGATGDASLISAGEINPLFGGTGAPYVVAYSINGHVLTTPTLVVPQDTSRSRFVDDLVDLSVGAVPGPPAGPRVPSDHFDLVGVLNATTHTLSTLQALPAITATNVSFFSGATLNGPHDYTGSTCGTSSPTPGSSATR